MIARLPRTLPRPACRVAPQAAAHRPVSLTDFERFHGCGTPHSGVSGAPWQGNRCHCAMGTTGDGAAADANWLWSARRMLVGPGVAQRCIETFNGRILFMSSGYSRDAASFPLDGAPSPWEVASLSLVTYYLLVAVSLTGLSTLLRQTAVLDARDGALDERDGLLASTATPSLRVDPCVLDYLVADDSSATAVKVKRRFEFHFRLACVRVVMLHLVSLGSDGHPILRDGTEVTHLVEVYECPWGQWMVHPAVWLVASGAATLLLLACGALVS